GSLRAVSDETAIVATRRLLSMLTRLLAGAALGAMLTACTTMEDTAMPTAAAAIPQATGVFAAPSALPFGAPDFTRITDADYQPAIEQGIAIRRAEVEAIANSPEPA